MKTYGSRPGSSVSIAAGLVGALFLLTGIVCAQSDFPKTPGVWLSDEPGYAPGSARVEELTQSLRRITGLKELHFEKDGSLATGAAQSAAALSEGSATARQILSSSLNSGFVFIIEDHSDSPSVNFGQINEGLRYQDGLTGLILTVWRVRLDFSDFRAMQASREVKAAFDVGFTTLHELLHGLGYKDATKFSELGECEEKVNRSREELGLPMREQYFGDAVILARHFISVRLRFRSDKSNDPDAAVRKKTQYLFFMIKNDYEHSSPTVMSALDCGYGNAIQHKGAKVQRFKNGKGD